MLWIHLPLFAKRAGIVFRNDFLSIWIVYTDFLTPGIAGISHRKMRSCLLCDQDRHLIFNAIFSCHHIGSRIRSDGELSQRKSLMIFQYIIINIFPVLGFV